MWYLSALVITKHDFYCADYADAVHKYSMYGPSVLRFALSAFDDFNLLHVTCEVRHIAVDKVKWRKVQSIYRDWLTHGIVN